MRRRAHATRGGRFRRAPSAQSLKRVRANGRVHPPAKNDSVADPCPSDARRSTRRLARQPRARTPPRSPPLGIAQPPSARRDCRTAAYTPDRQTPPPPRPAPPIRQTIRWCQRHDHAIQRPVSSRRPLDPAAASRPGSADRPAAAAFPDTTRAIVHKRRAPPPTPDAATPRPHRQLRLDRETPPPLQPARLSLTCAPPARQAETTVRYHARPAPPGNVDDRKSRLFVATAVS